MIASVFSTLLLILALATCAFVFIVRTVIEYRFASLETTPLWRDLILPLLPVSIGVVLGICNHAVIIGLVAGFLSSAVYRAVKSALGVALATGQ